MGVKSIQSVFFYFDFTLKGSTVIVLLLAIKINKQTNKKRQEYTESNHKLCLIWLKSLLKTIAYHTAV